MILFHLVKRRDETVLRIVVDGSVSFTNRKRRLHAGLTCGVELLKSRQPADWVAVKPTLTPGAQVAPKYAAKMAADGFAGCGCAP